MSDVLSTNTFGRIEPERLLDTHLARVFFAAQKQRRSGVLTVDEGELTMHVHLTEGVVTYVDRGALAETLGRLLMRQGVIDREEYGLILEQMAEPSDEDAEVRRFGEVAIALGMLTEEELEDALRMQVAAKLQHCLTLDEGLWRFDGSHPPAPSRFPVDFEPTLRAALLEDPQSYRWPGLLVAKRTRRMRLDGEPEALAERFGMTEDELRLVRAMDGRPLADLLASRLLPPEQAGVIVVLLLFAGSLDLEAPASLRLDRRETAELRERARHRAPSAGGGTEEMDAISVAVAVREAHEAQLEREREEAAAKARAEAFAEVEAEALRKAQEEARRAGEEAAARIRESYEAKKLAADEARERALAELRAKAEAEARARAESEARARAEAEARARAAAEAEARARAEAEVAARRRAAAEARAKAEAEREAERARAKAEVEAKAAAAARAAAEMKAAALAKAAAEAERTTSAVGRRGADHAREAAERLRLEMERRHGGRRPDEGRPRLDAERLFEEGRKALAANALEKARELFEQAVALMPDAAEYRLHLAWARYLGTNDDVHRRIFENELRTAVLEALQQDRRMGFAHYVQGRLFLADEDLQGAARALKIAVHLDKSIVDAQRYLRLVQSRLGR